MGLFFCDATAPNTMALLPGKKEMKRHPDVISLPPCAIVLPRVTLKCGNNAPLFASSERRFGPVANLTGRPAEPARFSISGIAPECVARRAGRLSRRIDSVPRHIVHSRPLACVCVVEASGGQQLRFDFVGREPFLLLKRYLLLSLSLSPLALDSS